MRKKDYSYDDGLHTKRQQLETENDGLKLHKSPKKSCRQKPEGEVITIWVHPATRKKVLQNVSMVFLGVVIGLFHSPFFAGRRRYYYRGQLTSQLLSLFIAEMATWNIGFKGLHNSITHRRFIKTWPATSNSKPFRYKTRLNGVQIEGR